MMWGGSVEGAERESMRGGVEGAGGGDDAAFGKAKGVGFLVCHNNSLFKF